MTTLTQAPPAIVDPGEARGRGIVRRIGWPVAWLISLVLPIALWQWLAANGTIDPFFIGKPSNIWSYLHTWISDGTLFSNSYSTVLAALVGWVIGTAGGTAIGLLLGSMPTVRAIVMPFLAFINGLPRIIFYPFLAIWLGFTVTSKITLVVFVIVVLVIFNVMAGMREVSSDLVAHVRLIGGNGAHVAQNVYIPSLTVWIFSSSRVTAGFALQAAIVAEFLGPTKGLGYLAVQGTARFDINQTWAAITVMVVIGLIVDALLATVERRVSRWKIA
jgi:NitT/TauT family transport system permease protein